MDSPAGSPLRSDGRRRRPRLGLDLSTGASNGGDGPLRRSLSQASLRRRSAYLQELITGRVHARDSYDDAYRRALVDGGEVGNGVRTWYSSFTSIDWLHDQCKEDFRLRRLRSRSGLRGLIANNWDRFQGWLAVAAVGFFTAIIAAWIIGLEMWLFTAKDGYCSPSWWRAKRFCTCLDDARASCGQTWRDWGTVLDVEGGVLGQTAVEFGVYAVLAVSFAVIASIITIYLSASDSVFSTKDVDASTSPGASEPSRLNPANPPAATSRNGSRAREPRFSRVPSFPTYGATTEFSRSSSLQKSRSRSSDQISGKIALPLPLELNNGAPDDLHATALSSSMPESAPRKVMYFAAGSGIPEIKTLLGGFVIRGYLGGWTLVAKAVGLCFSVGSGLSLGKEGPFVHIASCVGNIVSRFFDKFDKNEAKRRELLSAACAAGVAVSFGAPVGGVLFSLEEVSYHFPPKVMFRSFVCAMIAATCLKFLDPFGSGKIVLFQVTFDKDWHFAELVGFAALGAFGGIYGALFNKANLAWVKRVRNGTSLKNHPIVEVALVAAVTVIVSFVNPFTRMGGTELVYEMFSECSMDDPHNGLCIKQPGDVWPLLKIIGFAMVAKTLLTVVTFGIKLPAGIFIPTLAVGACFGRILGLLVEWVYATHPTAAALAFCRASGPLPAPFGQACVLPGVWAVVGAAATLTGVTRTTVSLAVIIFELTGTLTYVTPVMLAVLCAKTVADAIETRSIYDLTIEANNLPYLDAKEEHILQGTVMDVADPESATIVLGDEEVTVNKLEWLLRENAGSVTGFPIVKEDDGPRLQGYIGFDELDEAVRACKLEAELNSTVPSTPCTFQDVSTRVNLTVNGGVAASGTVTPRAAEQGTASSQEGRRGIDQVLARANSRSGTWTSMAGGYSTTDPNAAPLDLGHLVDRAPVTVSSRAPLQLVHQLFIRLGVRYLAVQDERGCYVGMIEKNRWLGYLKWTQSQYS